MAHYPCLAFDQGDNSSFYDAEEILSTREYAQVIKANDWATLLNLMVGLNGYTLCSGIICEELNGSDYVAVPFQTRGRIRKASWNRLYQPKNLVLSEMGEKYIEAMKRYLAAT